MKLCISEATTMPASFAEDVQAYADAGCPALEVWLTKLEKHLEAHSPDATRKMLAQRGLVLAAAAYQGGLLVSQGEARQAHFEHFRRRLELCQYFRIPTLVVIADFLEPVESTSLARAIVSLKEAAQWAAGFQVKLALEFRASSRFCASLDTALALVTQCNEPNLGINLDLFHYYTGPSKFDDLAFLTPHHLAHVQVCDLAGVPRELATDSDRILPGEGDFRLEPILTQLRKIGYDEWIALELMNPHLWRSKASQVAELGLAALRRLVEPAP